LDQKHGWNKKKGERHTQKRRKRLKQQARNYKPVPSLKAPKKMHGQAKKAYSIRDSERWKKETLFKTDEACRIKRGLKGETRDKQD